MLADWTKESRERARHIEVKLDKQMPETFDGAPSKKYTAEITLTRKEWLCLFDCVSLMACA